MYIGILQTMVSGIPLSYRVCYFGRLEGVSNSVQVLFNGIEQFGIDFDISEMASPVLCPRARM